MNININKLRNRAINATVTVLKKAEAPDPVDRIFALTQKLPPEELFRLYANITDLIKETDNA